MRFIRPLLSVAKVICKIMLIIQVVSVTIVFFGRYFFNKTPAWGEELTLFCLVWISMLGAALAIRDDSHIRLSLIEKILPKSVVSVIDHIGNLIIFGFCAVVMRYGISATIQAASTRMNGIGISRAYLYASVPVAMFYCIMALLARYLSKSDSADIDIKEDTT